jgi:dienelactone hydrolase
MEDVKCCPTDKTAHHSKHYTRKGHMTKVNSMETYVVGADDAEFTVFMIFDIFGFHPNNFELADTLVEQIAVSTRVVIPDFFRGSAWPAIFFPPKGDKQAEFQRFFAHQANVNERLEDFQAVIDHFKPNTFGILGFCWGCKLASMYPKLSENDGFVGVAGAHPSLLNYEDGKKIAVSTLWLPTKDDDLSDYENGYRSLIGDAKTKPELTISEEFRDMFHGFMASRGDWSMKDQRKRAFDGIGMIIDFFNGLLIPMKS